MRDTRKFENILPMFVRWTAVLSTLSFALSCGTGLNRLGWRPTAWYHSSWQFRQAVTIQASQVASDLTNFPVLVSLSSGSVFSSAQVSGNDILFTAGDGTTKLSHELEVYDGSSSLVAWVNVPAVNANSNTVIYIYYGNSSATSQQDKTGTWNSDYVSVWHMNESPANNVAGMLDSTSNSNDGTPLLFDGSAQSDTDATGKIAGAALFDGTDDTLSVSNSATLDLTGVTISAWVKRESDKVTGQGRILERSDNAPGTTPCYSFVVDFANGLLGSEFRTDVTTRAVNGVTALTAGIWYFAALTFDGNSIRIYLNGVEDNSLTWGGAAENIKISSAMQGLGIGNQIERVRPLDGTLDEVRLSSSARDAGWLATSYANQNSPASFFSMGDVETEN